MIFNVFYMISIDFLFEKSKYSDAYDHRTIEIGKINNPQHFWNWWFKVEKKSKNGCV